MEQVLATIVTVSSLAVAAFGAYRLVGVLRGEQRLNELSDYLWRRDAEDFDRWRRRAKELEPDIPLEPPRRVLVVENRATWGLVALIVASLAIASTTTLVEASAGDSEDADPAPSLPQSQGGSGDDEAFTGPIQTRHRVPKRKGSKGLCLMRYTDRSTSGPREGGRWWTSCRTGESLPTVEDVKEVLALPARFGAVRDARTKALVPAGMRTTYRQGVTAPQCEEDVLPVECRGHIYAGGGWQYEFSNPAQTKAWIVTVDCSDEREDQPSAWTPC